MCIIFKIKELKQLYILRSLYPHKQVNLNVKIMIKKLEIKNIYLRKKINTLSQ